MLSTPYSAILWIPLWLRSRHIWPQPRPFHVDLVPNFPIGWFFHLPPLSCLSRSRFNLALPLKSQLLDNDYPFRQKDINWLPSHWTRAGLLYVHLVVWSFVCSFVTMPKCLVHKKMVVNCILAIKARGKTLFLDQIRRGKINDWSSQHSRH